MPSNLKFTLLFPPVLSIRAVECTDYPSTEEKDTLPSHLLAMGGDP